jgi:hypothetical protein
MDLCSNSVSFSLSIDGYTKTGTIGVGSSMQVPFTLGVSGKLTLSTFNFEGGVNGDQLQLAFTVSVCALGNNCVTALTFPTSFNGLTGSSATTLTLPVTASSQSCPSDSFFSKYKIGIIVGACAGGVMAIAGAVYAVIVFRRRQHQFNMKRVASVNAGGDPGDGGGFFTNSDDNALIEVRSIPGNCSY